MKAVHCQRAIQSAPCERSRFPGGEGAYPPSGLSDPALRAEIPADLVSGDPLEAISVANRLLSVGEEPKTAADYLGALGRNVQQLRKQRGWSQQELAAKAGLDRAYLSTVEKGRQNITIGAAARIAAALDTSLSALIGEEGLDRD